MTEIYAEKTETTIGTRELSDYIESLDSIKNYWRKLVHTSGAAINGTEHDKNRVKRLYNSGRRQIEILAAEHQRIASTGAAFCAAQWRKIDTYRFRVRKNMKLF